MPKKLKQNRKEFKRNQAFVQMVNCTLSGHEKGSVFVVDRMQGSYASTGNGLQCNRKRALGFISLMSEVKPFTLGMLNRQGGSL